MTSTAPPAGTGPRIGTLVTCRDYAPFVGQAVRSVLCQRPPPYRLLVVDDGSTDGSADAIASTLDEVPHAATNAAVVTLRGRGQLGALRRGLAELDDVDVVTFLDADDLWWDGHLAAVRRVFSEDPLLDVSYSPYWEVDGGSRRPVTVIPPGLMRDDWLRAVFGYAWRGVPTSGIGARRDVATALLAGPDDAMWSICADDLIVLGAAVRQLRRRVLPTATVGYRMHGHNLYASTRASAQRSPLVRTLRVVAITSEARQQWRSMTPPERRRTLRHEVRDIAAAGDPADARRCLTTLLRSVPTSTSERVLLLATLLATLGIGSKAGRRGPRTGQEGTVVEDCAERDPAPYQLRDEVAPVVE